jgi:hypothetical protein
MERDIEKEIFVFMTMASALDEIGHLVCESATREQKQAVNRTRVSLKQALKSFEKGGGADHPAYELCIEGWAEAYAQLCDAITKPS